MKTIYKINNKIATLNNKWLTKAEAAPIPTGGDTVTLAGRIWKTNNVTGEFGTMYSDCTSGTTTAAEGPQWFYTQDCCNLINQAYAAEGWRVPTSADWVALFNAYGTPAALSEAGFNNANIGYYMYDDDPYDSNIPEWYDCEMFGCSTPIENDPGSLSEATIDYNGQENRYEAGLQWGWNFYSVRLVKDI